MLLNLLSNGFDKWALIELLLCLPIILFSLSLHETAHGFIAYKLGDPTARNLGRLTLNPFKHLDPIGALCMLIFGFGWAKPVPINTRYFKNPRRGMALTGIAGPISNLLLAIVCYILSIITFDSGLVSGLIVSAEGGLYLANNAAWIVYVIYLFFTVATNLNVALAIFNLIPVPPFDGSRFMYMLLPQKWYFKVMKYEQYTGLVVFAIIFILSRVGIYQVSIVSNWVLRGFDFLFATPIDLLFGIS